MLRSCGPRIAQGRRRLLTSGPSVRNPRCAAARGDSEALTCPANALIDTLGRLLTIGAGDVRSERELLVSYWHSICCSFSPIDFRPALLFALLRYT